MSKENFAVGKADTPGNNDEINSNVFHVHGKLQLSTLPDELLLRIFKLLVHSDLSSLMLLNKKFSNLASDPVLWQHYQIPAMDIAQLFGLDVLGKVLQLPRFSKLQVLDLSRILGGERRKNCLKEPDSASSQQFQEILVTASSLPLKKLDLSYNNLAGLPTPDLLSRLVLRIQHVELVATFRSKVGRGDDWSINHQILSDILEGISVNSSLRTLNLSCCELEGLPLFLIAKLKFLSNVSLEGSFMTTKQARVLLIEMGKGTKIIKLDLGCESIIAVETLGDALERVEPEVVAMALNNVEYLIYHRVYKTNRFRTDVHLSAFLEEMGRKTKLKKFMMKENNYIRVDPGVVGKAFNKLEYIEFQPNSSITRAQIVEILNQMALNTNVVGLKFVYEDIFWLNPDLLAKAVVQVEQVDMLCKMYSTHILAILEHLDANSKIRRLNLGSNDLSKVPENVLTKAVDVIRKNGGTVFVRKNQMKTLISYSNESLGFL